MFRLVLVALSSTLVAGWSHLASFNDACGADISFLRGTQFEASATAGRIPYQFKLALQEVVKARVALEGCSLTSVDQLLYYGMDAMNIMRILDASDKTLNQTNFPCNVPNIAFHWQKIKRSFPGFILPTSCSAASFATSKTCFMKFQVLNNLFIEIAFSDKCSDPNQPGYGLPQLSFSCSGSLCSSFAAPCLPGVTTCGGGLTCDAITNSQLVNALKPLIEMGLFDNSTDINSCSPSGGPTFQEKFFSEVINNVADMLGLTTGVKTDVYSSVTLCGIKAFQDEFIPTDSPTPAPMFRCPQGGNIPLSKVCDNTPDCPISGDDELHCRCGMNNGMIDDGAPSNWNCCPVCFDYNNNNVPYSCNNYYCGSQGSSHGGGGPTFCDFSDPSQGVHCSNLLASSGPGTLPAAQPLSFVSSTVADEHPMGFGDCNSNFQIGNNMDLGVVNFRFPIQNIATRVEKILKDQEVCRGTVSDWKRYFFPWAVNFWGGVFFSDQAAGNVLGNINPGAKVDQNVRFYHDANTENCTNCGPDGCQCTYTMPPPFANVVNAPASCNIDTTTMTGSCELALDITNWFSGSSFPTGWTANPTIVRIKATSSCTGSAVPQIYIACEGPCTATKKSGCCMLKEPFVPQNGPSTCPPGYKLQPLNSDITDFLFNVSSTVSVDSTLINFVNLVGQRTWKFSYGAAGVTGTTVFIPPASSDVTRSFCLIDGSAFDNNTQAWGDSAATDYCPYPPVTPTGNGTRGCPQILSGGLKGCTTDCLTTPQPQQCPASGCPQAPSVQPPTMVSSASSVAPVLVVAFGLGLILF